MNLIKSVCKISRRAMDLKVLEHHYWYEFFIKSSACPKTIIFLKSQYVYLVLFLGFWLFVVTCPWFLWLLWSTYFHLQISPLTLLGLSTFSSQKFIPSVTYGYNELLNHWFIFIIWYKLHKLYICKWNSWQCMYELIRSFMSCYKMTCNPWSP